MQTLLVLGEKRMDDAQPGEDPATAGEFIHVLDVLPRSDPSYKDLIFEPANVTGKMTGRGYGWKFPYGG